MSIPSQIGVGHLIFYAAITAIYVYTLVFDTDLFRTGKYKKVGFPFDDSFGGRAKFLTYNNLALQIVYFSLLTLTALFNCLNFSFGLKLRRVTNLIHTSLAFPLAWTVSIAFWSLYFIDRKLIFPKILDSIMPVWLNHALHTLPFVSLLIETYVTKHRYTTFLKGGLLCGFVMFSYILWSLFIAFHTDNWVYPILRMLPPVHRGMFIGSNMLFTMFLYKMGEYLNSYFWAVKVKAA